MSSSTLIFSKKSPRLSNSTISIRKTFVASALILFFITISLKINPRRSTPSDIHGDAPSLSQSNLVISPTNISHLVFGIVGSTKAWKHRKSYIESWWRPNITRGYLYLDTPPTNDLLPWSSASPPFRVSDDNTKLLEESKHVAPIMVRMVHAILEVFREGDRGVRWYVMGDDDSIFFVDNMVHVLSKYDHTKFVYIGGHSESISSNYIHSFDMGFGGAGFALSYALAEVLVKNLEDCLKRYPYLIVADQILMSCVADFGVPFIAEKGLHQVDLRGDISGFLSSHPQSPLLSLHHIDKVKPIFPSMDRVESLNHLAKAANVDQSRLLQQTICYRKQTNWSFSISWGYSAHIYEEIIPRSILKKPLETFKPWSWYGKPPLYLFNTRPLSNDPCQAPHIFSFESIDKEKIGTSMETQVLTSYVRVRPRGLPSCEDNNNNNNRSADHISMIQVFSSMAKPVEDGKSECCDVVDELEGEGIVMVKLRTCKKDELIA